MTSTPKIATRTSSGTTTYGVRSRSSSRLETTKPTAPPPWRRSVVSPRSGCGLPAAMCTMPEHPEGQGGPSDHLSPGRSVVHRVAHRAPPGIDQRQRHQPADLADRAGDDRAGHLHHRAGHLPPHGRGGDHRERQHQKSGTVAAVLWLQLGRGATDPAGDRPEGVRHAQPRSGGAAAERVEEPVDRPRAPACGRWRSPARERAGPTAAGAAGAGTPGSGAGPRRRGLAARGRAPAPRPRRGRRTGRHGETLSGRPTSITHPRSVSSPRPCQDLGVGTGVLRKFSCAES